MSKKKPKDKKHVSKEYPPSEFLNCEIAEHTKNSIFSVISRLKKSKNKRSSDEEITIENRILDNNQNNEQLVFKGPLDGITHYLMWMLIFIMPIFIPYMRSEFFETPAPTLLTSTITYLISIPFVAYFLYFVTRSINKNKMQGTSKVFALVLSIITICLFFTILRYVGLLPSMAFATKAYSVGGAPKEFALQAWFSTFSNGKFLFTYLTTILIVVAFIAQQLVNRDRLVLRLPLRKIFFFFFLIHFISLLYPLTHPGESSTFEIFLRIHQWLQYFLIFLILVNTMTSLGRILSIAKSASLSGTIVALIGVLQYFFSEYATAINSNGVSSDVFESYVNMNPAQPPFSTFGQNNFAAAYVCLSIPLTISLICSLSSKLIIYPEIRKKISHYMTLFFWGATLIIQFIYLTVSMGKAGIVSMLGAIIITAIVGLFVLEPKFKRLLLKVIVFSIVAVVLGFSALFAGLSLTDKTHYAETTITNWENKLSKTFNTKEGSNRVRIFYVGAALRIMKQNVSTLLTGVGANNYRIHYPLHRHPEESKIEKAKHVNQSHCDYAQFASDLGLMGLFVFTLLMIHPLIIGIRILINETNLIRRFVGLGFYCTLVAMSINALFFFPFQTPGSLLPYFVSLGLFFSLQRKDLDLTKENKVTVFLVSLLVLSFLFYEAWFSSEYYEANVSIWFYNFLLLLLGWFIIYIVRLAIKKTFKKDGFFITPKNDIVLASLFVLSYVTFSYYTAISYIFTDHIRYRNINIKNISSEMEHHYRYLNRIRKLSNNKDYMAYIKKFMQQQPRTNNHSIDQFVRDYLHQHFIQDTNTDDQRFQQLINQALIRLTESYMEQQVYKRVLSLEKHFLKAVDVNAYNPDVYNNFNTALENYYILTRFLNNRRNSEIVNKYALDKPFDSENSTNKYVEGKLLKLWPNNKDYYNKLSSVYFHRLGQLNVDHPLYDEIASKTLLYSRKYLDINPSGDQSETRSYKGSVLDRYINTAVKTQKNHLIVDFYDKKIKNNWSVRHDICMILAQHFLDVNNKPYAIDAKIHSFKVHPKDSSNPNFEKYQSTNDIKALHLLLSEDKAKYPNGLIDILNSKRRKSKVIDYLSKDIKSIAYADYQALSKLLQSINGNEALKKIQDHQLRNYIQISNLILEKPLFIKLNPQIDFDRYILNILHSSNYHITPQTMFNFKESFYYILNILSINSSQKNKKLIKKLLTTEILHYINKHLDKESIEKLQKHYNTLDEKDDFKTYINHLIKSHQIKTPAKNISLLKELIK